MTLLSISNMEPEIGVSDLHALYIQSLSTLSRITELFADAEVNTTN